MSSNTVSGYAIGTGWPMSPSARDTDLCMCGHKRIAHDNQRGRCYMETWPRHRCSCSLFKPKKKP